MSNVQASLFSTVPDKDALGFGRGSDFKPKQVSDWLGLKKADVSKVAGVAQSSVRWDSQIPDIVRERLQEIAATCNQVAAIFDGDAEKTHLWFTLKNPMLGDVSPRDMVRLGKFDQLRRFIISAIVDNK